MATEAWLTTEIRISIFTMIKKVAINSMTSFLLFFVNTIIAFIMSPILLNKLGYENYGVWEILLSIVGYLGILEIGIGPALVRFYSREIARENIKNMEVLFNTTLFSMAFIGIFSFLVILIVSAKANIIFKTTNQDVGQLQPIFIINGINLLVQFPGTVFTACMMAYQRHYYLNTVRIIVYSLQAILIYYCFTYIYGSNLMTLCVITLVFNIIQFGIIAIRFIHEKHGTINISIKDFSKKMIFEMIGFGINNTLYMISDRIQKISLPIIIAHTVGIGSVAFFVISKKLIDYANGAIQAIGYPFMAYFSFIDANREKDKKLTEWIPLSRAIVFVSIPIGIAINQLGETFLEIWVGPEISLKASFVISTFSCCFLITSLFANSNRVLIAGNMHAKAAQIGLITTIVSLCLSLFMGYYIGIYGIALIFIVCEIVCSITSWIYALEYSKISIKKYLCTVVFPFIIPGAVFLFIANYFNGGISYLELIKTCITASLFYFLTVFIFTSSLNQKKILFGRLKGLIRNR